MHVVIVISSTTVCLDEFCEPAREKYWRVNGGQGRERLRDPVRFYFGRVFESRNVFSIVTTLFEY